MERRAVFLLSKSCFVGSSTTHCDAIRQPFIDRYAASPETELRLGELLAEDHAILSQYLPRPAGRVSDGAQESETEGLGDGT